MKIIIDNKIPYIEDAFKGKVEYEKIAGHKISRNDVHDADALIVRTRTKCDEKLLAGTSVKIVATATIGHDHIDTKWCEEHGITWKNAPGCNSGSVAQYILASLATWSQKFNEPLMGKTIGIIGVGNVGKKVAKIGELLGMNVLKNDPPRKHIENSREFVDLSVIQESADIITLHVPFTRDGKYATFHMVDEDFIKNCKKNIVFINSARGEVMETESVLRNTIKRKIHSAIIDCWENEPEIDHRLLENVFISTPHIAGYSRDGKAIGTTMSVHHVSKKLGLGLDNWEAIVSEQPQNHVIEYCGKGKDRESIIKELVLATYSIEQDSELLKEYPGNFELQRGSYPVRREFFAYKIRVSYVDIETIEVLKAIGFQVENHF